MGLLPDSEIVIQAEKLAEMQSSELADKGVRLSENTRKRAYVETQATRFDLRCVILRSIEKQLALQRQLRGLEDYIRRLDNLSIGLAVQAQAYMNAEGGNPDEVPIEKETSTSTGTPDAPA